MHDRKHRDCHCSAPALSPAAWEPAVSQSWDVTRAAARNKTHKDKIRKRTCGPEGCCQPKGIENCTVPCTASMETTRDLLLLVLFITLLDSSQRTLYRMSPGSFYQVGFFPLQRKITDLVLFPSPQKFCYEAKCFKPQQPQTNLI